ncbi:MAG: beta strand repeat-containing protein, partial [Planctomycetota bacterium]
SLVLEDRIRTSSTGSIVLESQGSITLGATSTFTTNNANLGVFAGSDIRIGSINAGSGSVLLASGGNISEINPSTTATQIVAQNLSMRAEGRIGDSDLSNSTFDNNRNAIVLNATNLAARAGDSIYIQDKGIITVDRISTILSQVAFNSTTSDRSEVLEDLSTTANNGNIKLQSLAGDIRIQAGTLGTAGINAHGSGDILLQTGNSGSIVVNADIVSGSGDITLNSRGSMSVSDRLKTSRPGMIALISEGTISVSSLNTNGVDLGVFSTTGIVLGSIRAEGASVAMSAGTSISDMDSSNATLNVIATNLSMGAGTRIGNSDTGQSNVDLNRNAISTRVDTLAASAATGIYLQEQDGVTIDRISTTIQRVNFNSTSVGLPQNIEDLTTSNNGPILLQSLAGDIRVNSGTAGTAGISAQGAGNVLLQTVNSGTIILGADILSGSGNITLASKDALTIDQRLKTSGPGSLYLVSQSDLSIAALNTNNTNLRAQATGNLFLGNIQAGTGNVSLQAGQNILDDQSLTDPVHIVGSKLTMIAGGKIGESDTNSPANINTKALVTQVGSLAARSGTGIYIQELDALSIESISNNVLQVNFRGNTIDRTQVLEDLTTTSNGPIKLQSLAGSITVNAGTIGTHGITANGTGDVLLQTLSGGNINANAGILSGTGHITLDAAGTLTSTSSIQTGGAGSVFLSSLASTSIASLSTAGGNVQVLSGGDLTLGSINAGNGQVYLQASGDIKDSDPSSNSTNVIAGVLAMRAGGKIGDSDTGSSSGSINRNAIGTQVSGLAAQSASGIYVQEADGVTIDTVSVSSQRVNFNSTRSAQSQVLEDLTTTSNGPIKLQSLAGSITVNPGTAGTNGITANGTGDILLQTVTNGTIVANGMIQSGSGNITLSSRDSLVLEDRIRTSSTGSIVLESQGSI